MSTARHVRLLRQDDHQTVEIPDDLRLPGNDALIYKQGDKLVIEPVRQKSLSKLLASWEPLDVEWPQVEDPTPEPVDLDWHEGDKSDSGK